MRLKIGNRVLLSCICLLLFSSSVLSQVDVPRETKAITFPLNQKVYVIFRGTTRFPRMKGEAKVERTKKNGTLIELSVSKMPRPFELGAGYATYVLWAISPNGQIDNLGEIKRRGFFEFDSKIKVTTPLQTFALIVTAEPHFLVSRPSQEIMLENFRPYSKTGRTIATATTIQYFGNSSDYFNDARTPEIADIDYRRTPTSILQAKQAIALAKYSGAERDAPDELQQATTLLENAETAWKAGRDEQYVDIAARRSISSAVQAENTANVRKAARERRNEQIRRDAELKSVEDKYLRAQSEIADLKAELSRERRARELAERDSLNYSDRLRVVEKQVTKLTRDLQDSKVKLATVEASKKALEDERERDKKLQQLKAKAPELMKSLERFGSVAETERGIILTLPESYWSGMRVSSFAESSETKMSWLAEVISQSPDYHITIEAHTDDRGSPEELQVLTDERSRAVADKLVSFGIEQKRMDARGFGGSFPIAPNDTRGNRSKNRRVTLAFIPVIN